MLVTQTNQERYLYSHHALPCVTEMPGKYWIIRNKGVLSLPNCWDSLNLTKYWKIRTFNELYINGGWLQAATGTLAHWEMYRWFVVIWNPALKEAWTLIVLYTNGDYFIRVYRSFDIVFVACECALVILWLHSENPPIHTAIPFSTNLWWIQFNLQQEQSQQAIIFTTHALILH